MKKRAVICFGLWMSILLLTGCWDRKELNDRAIWLATGIDVGEDGDIEFSGQITLPSKDQSQGGGGGEQKGQSFLTISAKGRNVEEALQNLQTKLSREAFFGQRRVIFLGEDIAKRGLKNELDIYNRDPQTSIRTDIIVVKGGKAKEALALSHPLEKYPAVAALNEHRESGGRGDTAYLHFLTAANRDGIRPSIATMEISKMTEGNEGSPNPKVLRLSGVSVFDRNLKMLGYLNNEENRDLLLVTGILKKMTVNLPEEEGKYSMNFTTINCKIKPNFDENNRVLFVVHLEGEGELRESNSELDMMKSKNLNLLEEKFEKEVREQVQRTIEKVQKEYGMDVFGFGEVIHRKNPVRWKSLKERWDQTFPNADISVIAKIKIKRIGMEGPSILFKESE